MDPIVSRQSACKCCGASAPLYGVVDFHKHCQITHRHIFDVAGIPIYYYRCPACRFIFTTAFDRFTPADFRRYIYNDDYVLVDPDYLIARPRANAAELAKRFCSHKPRRILDYGGGQGVLAADLRSSGFDADTYDPLVPEHAARPAQRYDCIVSFEVVEHATDPAHALADMAGFLAEPGVIFFSTLLQPADIERQGLDWWYAAPRNGHVSLYTREALAILADAGGLRFGSFDDSMHALTRGVPDFAQRFLKP